MNATVDTKNLTHKGALDMLLAGVAAAEDMGQPQCIVIVDASGETIRHAQMKETTPKLKNRMAHPRRGSCVTFEGTFLSGIANCRQRRIRIPYTDTAGFVTPDDDIQRA